MPDAPDRLGASQIETVEGRRLRVRGGTDQTATGAANQVEGDGPPSPALTPGGAQSQVVRSRASIPSFFFIFASCEAMFANLRCKEKTPLTSFSDRFAWCLSKCT
jgi:hypothetical protein